MKYGIVNSADLGDNWSAEHHLNHRFEDVRSHHFIEVREGSLGPEPTYIHRCACGATFRHGFIYPPNGYRGVPYDRERAIEASLNRGEAGI